jgi:hypothetical protein
MPDGFDPAEFEAFKSQQRPRADLPDAQPAAPTGGFDPAKFAAYKAAQTKPPFDPTQPFQTGSAKPPFDPSKPFQAGSNISFDDIPKTGLSFDDLPMAQAAPSLLDRAKEGVKGLARGAEGFVGDLGEAVMGPFGPSHHAANLMADIGLGQRPAPEPTYGQQLAHATGVESKKPSYEGTIGEFLGNPSTYFGPGGWLRKMLMGTASGAGSEAAGEAAEGTGWEGPARTAGALAAGPVAARVMKPQLAPAQQALADAGVTQMTPGQLIGGMSKGIEDAATSIPLLGHFIQNARGRSIESFNKAVANQALEPIGERLSARTPAGHPAVDEVATKLGDAYDSLLPKLNFIPDRQYAVDMNQIRTGQVARLPSETAKQFESIVDSVLGPPAPMNGRMLKDIESELSHEAANYKSSSVTSERNLGQALDGVVKAIRTNLERSNPDHAAELGRINSGWAMYARMRGAAANRATSEGVFTPSDLLSAVKRGDKSVGKGSFARGDALMQDFAEAGQKVLPSKIPDSGTAGRALTAGAIGALSGGAGAFFGYPGIAAAGAAALAPYTRPSMALLNRYVRPTTGLRADYSNVGRGVGTLKPFLQTSGRLTNPENPYSPTQ